MKHTYLFLTLIALLSCKSEKKITRDQINLEGQWQFALDTANIGVKQNWFLTGLNDSVSLPGTTDLNKKGFLNKNITTMHLSRIYKYEGAAWYRKKVLIPERFRNKHIQLFLERTKSSTIWVDSMLVGGSKLLQSPQQIDLSDYLTPGEHYITIRIDNSLKLTPYGNVHIYSDDTQTNWNGIIGKLLLEASPKTYISNLQVYPDINKKKIDINLEISNQLNLKYFDIDLIVEKTLNGKTQFLKTQRISKPFEPVLKLEYNLGDNCSLWDEYETPVYKLTAVISNGELKDAKSVDFGMRKFVAKGTQFEINGRTTFLRGKHEAGVFPLTGHQPMDVEGWERVYKIAKSYGINHYRFHSYSSPEAAFIAADKVGIYIQAELPFWGGLETDSVTAMLKEEGLAMLKTYGNHPSFVMFSPGNEIWSGHDRVEKNITALKASDKRVLYAMGSNNNIGYAPPRACSDFFIGARVPDFGDTTLAHTRLTHSFADAKDGGLLNTKTPSTDIDFSFAISHLKTPIVSHEIGQYQVYPDYDEIRKYTGVLRPLNLQVFRQRLLKAGMLDQNKDFQKASGAWAALCYKAEMEAAIRTKGMAGFQLLDLQDFPGQGTALVGILDAFMDSKNVISNEVWLQSCNDVVILLEFPKYCWSNNEKFKAKAVVANYSNRSINSALNWEIKGQNGNSKLKGTFPNLTIKNGGISVIGYIEIDLSSFKENEKLNISVALPTTTYSNSYPVWVYKNQKGLNVPKDIIITEALTSDVLTILQKGAKVLLFPRTEDVKDKSVPGLFPPEFWNYGMFKSISASMKKPVSPGTLGILTNPKHPVFKSFPTDFHSNWQWFSIIKASNSFILDHTPISYRPIVQVIDNLERNHKLGLLFEFKVGQGKLLVCMSQLNQLKDKPEAVQFYQSILNYMESKDFSPDTTVSQSQLTELFRNGG